MTTEERPRFGPDGVYPDFADEDDLDDFRDRLWDIAAAIGDLDEDGDPGDLARAMAWEEREPGSTATREYEQVARRF